MHRCGMQNHLKGRRCSKEYSRPYHLKKHMEVKHQGSVIAFYDCAPGVRQRVTYHGTETSPPRNIQMPSRTHASASLQAASQSIPSPGVPVTLQAQQYHQAQGYSQIQLYPATQQSALSLQAFQVEQNPDIYPITMGDASNIQQQPQLPYNQQSSQIELDQSSTERLTTRPVDQQTSSQQYPASCPTNGLPPIDESTSNLEPITTPSPETTEQVPCDSVVTGPHKRKRSFQSYDRITRARLTDPIPRYPLRPSTKAPGQLKAIEWLTSAAKRMFDSELRHRLAQWGVNGIHQGTCVLIPEDWKGVDPMDLVHLFDPDNCPTAQVGRLRYQFADHNTAFVRAKAWFDDWPRSGLQLDNFIGSGPFKPMDASHTCHQNLCIVHIVFEPANTNHDRKDCALLAQRLRREGKEIPECCSKHEPACLLQHAALTTCEAFIQQFNVLRQARGLEEKTFPRPRRHLYSSFETALPCHYTAVNVDPLDIVTVAPEPLKSASKPNLLCVFCAKIKNFDSIAGYWGHLVHKHDGIDTDLRLAEIRRSASVWRDHWSKNSEGGKKGSTIQKRLMELEEDEGLDWERVLSWELP